MDSTFVTPRSRLRLLALLAGSLAALLGIGTQQTNAEASGFSTQHAEQAAGRVSCS